MKGKGCRFQRRAVQLSLSENETMRRSRKRWRVVAVKPTGAGFPPPATVTFRMTFVTSLRAMGIPLGALVACIAWGGGLARPRAAVQPAVWVPRELLVQLHDLPKLYSCDALERKFRSVVTNLGARPDVRVLAYRCGPGSGRAGYSPSIHLHFQTPQVVAGAQTQWSSFDANRTNVRSEIVRLRPGEPSALDDSDCALLRQMKSTLFPALSIHSINYRLACQAPPSAHPRFDLSVAALIPTSAGAARVASRR
jgi:hypothetical protein